MTRTAANFREAQGLYQQGKLNELTTSQDGYVFLLLRSIARKEYLEYVARLLKIDPSAKAKDLLELVFLSGITAKIVEKTIRFFHLQDRATRKQAEPDLLAELFKLRVFDWGGIHENDINKHIVNNYIKKITKFDDLVEKIENEILNSLKGFVLCSWYNNWTSIIIEDIFKDHQRVLPTVGKIKQVDFFVEGIPFDLKMTYFPGGFMEEQRQKLALVRSEASELKRVCKEFNIPIDSGRQEGELVLDMLAALSESSKQEVRAFYEKFTARRRTIVSDTIADPRRLLRWLYENQGTQRFDTSNRLFLIVVDLRRMEDSWKLKRDHELLKQEIGRYLDSRRFAKDDLRLRWEFDGNEYESYTDILFVVKQ